MRKISLLVLILLALAGCKKPRQYTARKVLILGNSVTYSPPDPDAGWNGDWGMAASSAENDYVHLFTNKLTQLNAGNTVRIKNIAAFESNFDTYNIDQNLATYRDYDPDLLIVRIGENVLRNNEEGLFDQKYQELINYFKARNSSLKILAVGSVWPERSFANNVMRKHSDFISMDFLQYNLANYAFGMFADYSVQTHPSDKGMLAISDYLYATVVPILYP